MSEASKNCDDCRLEIPPLSPGGICPRCIFGTGDEPEGEVPGIEIGDLLGEGSFGQVYDGFQVDLSLRRVAVKIAREGSLSSSLRERFRAEMQILALMNHPNIARFVTSGETQSGRPFYAMEFVEGRELRGGQYSKVEILKTMAALCDTVAHAHQRGVVHRDLKASNVLIEEETLTPKIIDFGIARVLSGPL